MAKMTFQKLDLSKNPVGEPLEVQFNPTEYGLTKGAQFAEIAIPGLDSPVVQFVRGDSEKLTLELFFDTTEDGTGANATPVTTKVEPFYRLVKIDGELHAPPLVRLTWGEQFPGITTDQSERPIPAFDCVVESVSRQFTLFNSDGVPLRATVSLSLREYKTLEEQLQALNLQSADHTRVHVVRQGETLPQISYSAYQDPRRWRLIADHNDLLNVRHLTPGAVLELPPTTT
jgi:nucleoid-associated protein YgaU